MEAHHTSKDGKADEVLLSAVESLDEKISGKSWSEKEIFCEDAILLVLGNFVEKVPRMQYQW